MPASVPKCRFTWAAACAVLSLSLLVGACSNSSGTSSPSQTSPSTISSPTGYVASICGAGAAWNRSLQQRATDFSTKQAGVSDLNLVRQNLVDYLNALATDTEAFVAAIQEDGAPPVENGASIEADIVSGLKATAQSYRDAATQAGSLSTSDPSSFASGVTALAATIKQETKATKASLATIEHDKILGPLVKANADCTPSQGGA